MPDLSDHQLDDLIEAIGFNRPRPPRGPGARAACGTISGYERHLRLGEEPCTNCAAANRDSKRKRYHAPVTAPARLKPIAHGTLAGYKQHMYRKDPPCLECREANRVDGAARYAARKQAAK